MVVNWQTDRGQLNHKWLQNGVLVALNHALGVTVGTVRPMDVRQTLFEDIMRWQERHQKLPDLLHRFENEMSPRVFFDHIPLSRCDDEIKSWLIPLTHDLWLRQEKVKEKIDAALLAYKAAEKAYESLYLTFEQLPETPTKEDLGPLELLIKDFKTSCETLSRAISAFPHEIRCV